jgi:hypothetical protein
MRWSSKEGRVNLRLSISRCSISSADSAISGILRLSLQAPRLYEEGALLNSSVLIGCVTLPGGYRYTHD